MPNPPNLVSPQLVERAAPLMDALMRYHQHAVFGLENVPDEGPALMVINHSLATYDGLMLSTAIYRATGRMPTGLGDNKLFTVPGFAGLVRRAGIRPAGHRAGEALLDEGHIVGVAPGGMREALRPSDERYALRWQTRKGFIRLALRTGTPIMLAACPAADDLYTVYPSALTAQIYRRFRAPLPIVRGWGPTLLPRPVRLVHLIGAPIAPPPLERDIDAFEAQVDRFHTEIVDQMRQLMDGARVCAAESAPDGL